MLLAVGAHHTTVIPVEVVQVGIVLMGFFCGISCATGIVTPGGALEKAKAKRGQRSPSAAENIFCPDQLKQQDQNSKGHYRKELFIVISVYFVP